MTRSQQGLDARLVPAALTAWLVCGVGVALPPDVLLRAVAVLVVAGAAGVVAVGLAARPRGRHRRDLGSRAWATVALLVAAVCAAGAATAVQSHARRDGAFGEAVESGASVTAVLRLEQPASPSGAGFGGEPRVRLRAVVESVELDGSSAPARAPVLVLAGPDWSDVERGSTVRAEGRLRSADPGDDVVALLLVDDRPRLVERPGTLERAAARLRATLLDGTSDLAPHARGLLPGIAVGDTSRVPQVLERDMRTASLAHLVAVSGAHVAIVLGAVLALTAGAPRPVRLGTAALALGGLVVLVGPEPSVLRAGAMGVVTLGAFLLGRPARALPALATAVVVLLLVDPWAARSFGFALSVCATAGLVILAPVWTRALEARMPAPLAAAIAVPAAAQVACAPVVVLLDPGVSAYGIVANAAVAPVVAPVTVLTLLATLVGPWWPWAAHLGLVAAQAGTWWIERVATTTALAPGARLAWPGGVGGAIALAAVEGAVLVVLAHPTARARLGALVRAAVVPLLGGLLAVALATAGALVVPATRDAAGRAVRLVLPTAWPPPGWQLVQCDVGQGSALLLATGRPGHAVMVDVGPATGSAVACLRAAGITTIDLLVLTHADADHVGDLDSVLAAVDVQEAMVGPYDDGERDDRVLAALSAAGTRVLAGSTSSPDAAGSVGDVTWQVLWPTPRSTQLAGPDEGNDQSVTVGFAVGVPAGRISAVPGTLRVLVHGDLGAEAQSALARSLRTGDAPSSWDVVVVPHHGSADQDPGLAALTPARLALVSVGEGNDYGHPARLTLDLYARTGAHVARTDECGPMAVLLDADGALRLSGCEP